MSVAPQPVDLKETEGTWFLNIEFARAWESMVDVETDLLAYAKNFRTEIDKK